MTDKVTLNDLATFDNSIINSVNNNNDLITTAFNNTLSLDGTSPNQMNAAIDMNGFGILNISAPTNVYSPVRQIDLTPNTVVTFAAPSVTVGLTPKSGTATTATHSDSAPALDVTISPTWTGTHTFSNTVTSPSSSLKGSTSGTTVLQASAVASGTVTLPAATDTLVGKATTDILTHKTLDTAGTGNVLKINGTQVSAVTGTGSVVLATSPTLTSPTLTTPALGVASGMSVAVTGSLSAFSGTAVPAGGTTGSGIKFSSVTNLGVFFGSGVPTLSAAQGSLYCRTDGSTTATRLYVNSNGTTGWVAVTTAS